MRKWIAWGMILLCLLTMSACQKENPTNTSPKFNAETDAQSQYLDAGGIPQFAESAVGYYYLTLQGFLRFIDKEIFQDTAVCAKPDCLHDAMDSSVVSELETCNAYVRGSFLAPLFYYEGALYTVVRESILGENDYSRGYALIKIALDGTSRETIWSIDWDEKQAEITQPVFKNCLMHRGNFYFMVEEQAGDLQPRQDYLFCYDMAKKKCNLLNTGYSLSNLVAVGDQLFFNGREIREKEATMLRYTISTGEFLFFPEYETVTVVHDGLLFSPSKVSGNTAQIHTDLCGESPNEVVFPENLAGLHAVNENLFCGKEGLSYFSTEDGRKLTMEEYSDYVAAGDWGAFTFAFPTTCEFYDAQSLELLERVELPQGSLDVLCFMGNRVVAEIMTEQEHVLYFGELSAVGSGNFQWTPIPKVN